MSGVSLQKLCFDYTVQNLGAFPPAVLLLLPLTIRQEMLPLMCVADVYRMEASGFTKGMDTSDLWKKFFTNHFNYHKAYKLFPKNRLQDWKEDFSTALGYLAMHTDSTKIAKKPLLEVLFGTECNLPFAKYEGDFEFDQLMEIFEYMQFQCNRLVLKLGKINPCVLEELVHRNVTAKLQGVGSGNCQITKLCHCLEIFYEDDLKPVLGMFCTPDLQYIIHFSGSQNELQKDKFDDVTLLMKQPLFKSISVSGTCTFYNIKELLVCFFLNASNQEQTFSLDVSIITGIHSSKLRCSVDSCKSFLCSTSSEGFYNWFFSNSLTLNHLKLCAVGTEVLQKFSNLDFQVHHLELMCLSSASTVILSIRELQALTLVNVSLSHLCCFLTSALQSKLNLLYLKLKNKNFFLSYAKCSASDQWNLAELFNLIFSFPELKYLYFRNRLDKQAMRLMVGAWKRCSGRKLKKLVVSEYELGDLEKLKTIAVKVCVRGLEALILL